MVFSDIDCIDQFATSLSNNECEVDEESSPRSGSGGREKREVVHRLVPGVPDDAGVAADHPAGERGGHWGVHVYSGQMYSQCCCCS